MHYPVLPLVAFPGPWCRRGGGGSPPLPGTFLGPERKRETSLRRDGGRKKSFATTSRCAGEGKTKSVRPGGGTRKEKKFSISNAGQRRFCSRSQEHGGTSAWPPHCVRTRSSCAAGITYNKIAPKPFQSQFPIKQTHLQHQVKECLHCTVFQHTYFFARTVVPFRACKVPRFLLTRLKTQKEEEDLLLGGGKGGDLKSKERF